MSPISTGNPLWQNLILAFVFVVGGGCSKSFDAPRAERSALSQFAIPSGPIAQLIATRVFLRANLEGENLCGIDSTRLAQLPQLLEGELKTALQAENPAEFNEIYKSPASIRGCLARCDCETLDETASTLSSLGPDARKAYAEVREAAKKLTAKDFLACAKRNLWICKSERLKSLLAQTAE